MNKCALITGASRGIGRAIAIRFAKEGYSLVVNCCNSPENLAELKSEVENTYHVPKVNLEVEKCCHGNRNYFKNNV